MAIVAICAILALLRYNKNTTLEAGSPIEAKYGGKKKWYGGKVKHINPDGTVDVMYDDGDSEDKVKPENFRTTTMGVPAFIRNIFIPITGYFVGKYPLLPAIDYNGRG